MAAFYAVYHGPKGLKKIADTVHAKAVILYEGLKELGHQVPKIKERERWWEWEGVRGKGEEEKM